MYHMLYDIMSTKYLKPKIKRDIVYELKYKNKKRQKKKITK